MNPDITFRAAVTSDLDAILRLQQANLESQLSRDQIKQQGFVTVVHDLNTLKLMNDILPHAIAESDGQIVGYALAMHPSLSEAVKVLAPMFKMIEDIVKSTSQHDKTFMVMG